MTPERGSVRVGDAVIEYETVRSRRRRRTIEISVRPGSGVRVAAPTWTPREQIVALVRQRAAWIARQQERVLDAPAAVAWESGERLPYLGGEMELEVVAGGRARVRVQREGERLRIETPAGLAGDERAAAIERAVVGWYRRACAAEVEARVVWWAAVVGRTPRAVLVRDQRARWGSCAPDGTLRFNWRLVMAGAGVIDYVVVHELAHLVVRNHSEAFWGQVARVLPDYRERKAALKQVGQALPF